jgi:hypothetical protein
MVHPQVVDRGYNLQIAVNIFNKQLQAANKGCSSGVKVGRETNNSATQRNSNNNISKHRWTNEFPAAIKLNPVT